MSDHDDIDPVELEPDVSPALVAEHYATRLLAEAAERGGLTVTRLYIADDPEPDYDDPNTVASYTFEYEGETFVILADIVEPGDADRAGLTIPLEERP